MDHCLHRLLELLERDLPIAVLVGLVENNLPEFLIDFIALVLLRRVEQVLEVLQVDLAVLIGVNDLECFANVLVLYERFAVKARSNEVLKVNLTITIDVAFFNDLRPLKLVLLLVLPPELRLRYSPDVFDAQGALVVPVKPDECLLQLPQLLLRHAESGDEREHNFLELIQLSVLNQVLLYALLDLLALIIQRLVLHLLLILSNPRLLEKLADRRPRGGISIQTTKDEILCVLTHVIPVLILSVLELQILIVDVPINFLDAG